MLGGRCSERGLRQSWESAQQSDLLSQIWQKLIARFGPAGRPIGPSLADPFNATGS